MRRSLRTRLRRLLTSALIVAALGPVWFALAGMAQHACHCGLEEGCRCTLAVGKGGAHGHCHTTMKRCSMGRSTTPSHSALLSALDARDWLARPQARTEGFRLAPAGRGTALAVPLPISLAPSPETPPPRSCRSAVA